VSRIGAVEPTRVHSIAGQASAAADVVVAVAAQGVGAITAGDPIGLDRVAGCAVVSVEVEARNAGTSHTG
jgi:hypothetical protein